MVDVEPARREWLEALAVSDAAFTERFGIDVEPGWIGFPEALEFARRAADENDADPWGSQLFFDDGALVGFGGFKGPPTGGEVEIGYAVAPARRGRGIAGAAAATMIDRARQAGVGRVVAHTLPETSPSTSVLTRCGFAQVATVEDPDDDQAGGVWRWELELDPS